jgi:hypothetical protein
MIRVRKRHLAFVAATLLLAGVVPAAYATTRPEPLDPVKSGELAVATADYNLGDDAFRLPDFTTGDTDQPAPLELAGRVHYPKKISAGKYPMVLIVHGDWTPCADRAASEQVKAAREKLYGNNAPEDPDEIARLEQIIDRGNENLYRWPCAPGTPALPSLRGYDYLGKQLASHGFVVLSIGVNGINRGDLGEQDRARAVLADKHLTMWNDLVASGKGPLAGRLPSALRGHVDLGRVGLIGHSKGGRGVMWQAADAYKASRPAGVRIGAVLGLEPIKTPPFDDRAEVERRFLNTRIPSATILGSCGYASADYFDLGKNRSKAPVYLWNIHGANHNFFNTEWSPQSGQVDAADDAGEPEPGKCGPEGDLHRKLTEDQQREVGIGYMSAFFRRHLTADKSFDPMLTGRSQPLSAVTTVDVRHFPGL